MLSVVEWGRIPVFVVALSLSLRYLLLLPLQLTRPTQVTLKNKLQKRGAFFAPEKVRAKAPRSPHNPPRFHHKSTTKKHAFFQNTPVKTPIHHAKKNPLSAPQKIAKTNSSF
jgi:hypothetical protein